MDAFRAAMLSISDKKKLLELMEKFLEGMRDIPSDKKELVEQFNNDPAGLYKLYEMIKQEGDTE